MPNAPMSPNPLTEVTVEPTLGIGARDLIAATGKTISDDPYFVAYTDSETGKPDITYTDQKHLGPMSQYARVKMIIEPG
jgi:hypothetical protein